MRRRQLPTPLSDINVTNLVDVTLVLLIIIMITAPLLQTGIDIQLPRATTTRKDIFEGIIVSVSKEGDIYIGKDKVVLEEFPSKLKSLIDETQPGPVYLKADKEVPYGRVVTVIGAMKDIGAGELGLIAEPEVERR